MITPADVAAVGTCSRTEVLEFLRREVASDCKLIKGQNMEVYVKFIFNNDARVSGFDALFLFIANVLLIFPNVCIDIFVSVVGGALAGWLVGMSLLGTWIADGLRLMHMSVTCGDIYKLGAALGFIKCFFSIPRSSGNPKVSS